MGRAGVSRSLRLGLRPPCSRLLPARTSGAICADCFGYWRDGRCIGPSISACLLWASWPSSSGSSLRVRSSALAPSCGSAAFLLRGFGSWVRVGALPSCRGPDSVDSGGFGQRASSLRHRGALFGSFGSLARWRATSAVGATWMVGAGIKVPTVWPPTQDWRPECMALVSGGFGAGLRLRIRRLGFACVLVLAASNPTPSCSFTGSMRFCSVACMCSWLGMGLGVIQVCVPGAPAAGWVSVFLSAAFVCCVVATSGLSDSTSGLGAGLAAFLCGPAGHVSGLAGLVGVVCGFVSVLALGVAISVGCLALCILALRSSSGYVAAVLGHCRGVGVLSAVVGVLGQFGHRVGSALGAAGARVLLRALRAGDFVTRALGAVGRLADSLCGRFVHLASRAQDGAWHGVVLAYCRVLGGWGAGGLGAVKCVAASWGLAALGAAASSRAALAVKCAGFGAGALADLLGSGAGLSSAVGSSSGQRTLGGMAAPSSASASASGSSGRLGAVARCAGSMRCGVGAAALGARVLLRALGTSALSSRALRGLRGISCASSAVASSAGLGAGVLGGMSSGALGG